MTNVTVLLLYLGRTKILESLYTHKIGGKIYNAESKSKIVKKMFVSSSSFIQPLFSSFSSTIYSLEHYSSSSSLNLYSFSEYAVFGLHVSSSSSSSTVIDTGKLYIMVSNGIFCVNFLSNVIFLTNIKCLFPLSAIFELCVC